MGRTEKGRWVAAGLGGGIVLLASLPPFVGETAREVLMAAFSSVCHQLPARSAAVDGVPLAVCHRCYGIYWGLALAALAFPLVRRMVRRARFGAPVVLLLAVLPIAVDWGVDVMEWVRNTPQSRGATGWIFGTIAGYYLITALADAFRPSGTRESVPNPSSDADDAREV